MNVQSMITLYRNGFFVSLVITLVGLAAAILIFIKFDIHNIWLIRSGRSRRQSIEKMVSDSRSGGRMRTDVQKGTTRPGPEAHPAGQELPHNRTADLEEGITAGLGKERPNYTAPAGMAQRAPAPATEVLDPTEAPATEVLDPVGTPPTEVLYGGTEELTPDQPETTLLEKLPVREQPVIRITQEVVVTHCEDVID